MNWGLIIIILAVFLIYVLPKLRMISVADAAKLLSRGAHLIDVRSPGEFEAVSIPGSRNIPVNELSRLIGKADIAKDEPILVFCQSGVRSASAMSQLRALGYSQAQNVGSLSRARKIWMMGQEQGGGQNG